VGKEKKIIKRVSKVLNNVTQSHIPPPVLFSGGTGV
jgi:hypothetical protein